MNGTLSEIEDRVLIVLAKFVRFDALGMPLPDLRNGGGGGYSVKDFFEAIEEEFEIEIPEFDRRDLTTAEEVAGYLYARMHVN